MAIKVELYNRAHSPMWDDLITRSRNEVFLFARSYMDYHSDRFDDCSFLAFNGSKLVGVLPANLVDDALYSHQGLTFGGWAIDDSVRAPHLMEMFSGLADILRDRGVKKIIYKAVPYIFFKQSSQDDLYTLFRMGARLVRRELNSVVDLLDPLAIDSSRKDNLRKSRHLDLVLADSSDFDAYFELLGLVLSKHGVKPTHTAAEMRLLSKANPGRISLYACHFQERLLAGIILFDYGTVIHTQYMASSEEGRSLGALDRLIDGIRTNFVGKRRFLSFGISSEDCGYRLNEGLLRQKEGFGARSVVHDTYELDLG